VRLPGEIWRQRLWVWVPALVFFLANAGAFAVYKLGYAGRVETLQERLDVQKRQRQELAAQQRNMQAMLARVRTNEQQVEQLYAERLSTRSRRLTGITSEVKELARKSGMVPRSISYPEKDIEEFGLVKRSFDFSVEGTYAELRQFINLLEVSRSFLSLDEVTLTGNTEGPELQIDLSLSTLFAKESEDAGVPAPAPAASAGPAASGGAP
jgi:Tfp pilus assembly protein PilO